VLGLSAARIHQLGKVDAANLDLAWTDIHHSTIAWHVAMLRCEFN
jgi:hypothetical protein